VVQSVATQTPKNQYDYVRDELPGLPFMIREALIGNIVVGNLTNHSAIQLGRVLIQRFTQLNENLNGDGI
jgi:hypothetical protein